MLWIADQPEERQWVALSQDGSRVVATGRTCGEAVDRAAEAGELDPIMDIRPVRP